MYRIDPSTSSCSGLHLLDPHCFKACALTATLPQPTVSMSLEGYQRSDRNAERLDLLGAAEIRQIDHETGRHHIGTDFFQKPDSSHGGASGGDEIIDEDDPFTRNHGVIVDFHLVQ